MYRLAYMYSFILSTLFLLFWRLQFFKHIFPMLPRQKMLILGAGATGELVAQTTLKHMDSLMEIVGFLDDDTTKKTPPEGTLKILGSSQDALALCEKHQIDLVIVAITSDLRKETIYELMQLKMRGTDILDGVSFLKQMTGKIPIFHINETWLLFGPNFNLAKPGTLTKFQRQFDIIASSIGLTLTFPLLLIIACLLKISSKGPVVFRQERLGHMKKPYTILKFRTMIDNAEENSGAVWAEKNDPRVTPFGRFLRRTRLDELPQLWNVLSGEMSLIGPRPERKAFVDQLEKEIPYYPLRFTAKPGLTGWAQVNYRYGSSTDDAMEKLQYDLYYLQEMSVLLNLIILLRTVQTVILKPGS
jgi:exopolysaccharide biosynthesis polyprenyl glycosylphosphotransferase